MVNTPRFLIITYQAQGHINPALQICKALNRHRCPCHLLHFPFSLQPHGQGFFFFNFNTIIDNLSFSHFSNGYNNGFKPGDDVNHYFSEIRRCGSQALRDLIVSSVNEGHPFSCLVYTLMLPWAAKVVDELGLPSALLWIQPAIVSYYYYFHGYQDLFNNNNDPSSFVLPILKELFEILFEKEDKSKSVLVNTFNALEPEALRSIIKFDMIAVGPLIPFAFLDGKDPSNTSFGGDLYKGSKDYNE
ncbi:hypothetical protein FEM48_Zijuj07G0047800 [Ziziphus jujuba var. spinosa]|uniref:Crocetin glucosyltransferase, chloroplastic-like n=1 Tax=Ziziphus jujuba var. spinosa TaxID=714518 RepID=A0A978V2J1_ZIZJJ|nr:hypothetical protein FEM48_Zijuj07G0047800 [Ziziphus jujuba var. spinosa]